MIDKRAAFLFFFLIVTSFGVYGEGELLWISEIGLVKSEIYDSPTPPPKILIAVEMETDAYYKLSDRKGVLKGGLFNKGFNMLSIQADDLFRRPGSYVYYLDLKKGQAVLKKEIELDIQWNTYPIIRRPEKETENPEYRLSMYIGDELVYSSRKLPPRDISLKIDNPPWPDSFSPHDPVHRTDQVTNSFSVFSALGLAYDLIKKLTGEKSDESPVPPVQKYKQITTTFLKENPEGAVQEVKAIITLNARDIKLEKWEIHPQRSEIRMRLESYSLSHRSL
ncbi:MAG: hypothetical protein ACLFVG_02600 [Candidatus Aminicenantes bacterium]